MRKRFLILLIVTLAFSSTISAASADDLNLCKAKAPDWQAVSVGFPVKKERLNSLTNPKILVIPFKLKDTPDYSFSARMKQNYEIAANSINQLSNGKSKPQFVFIEPISTNLSMSNLQFIRENGAAGNHAKDERLSASGFVRNFIAQYDSSIDFKGFSAVILEGSMPERAIAEAMTFLRDWDPFFRPIITEEGEILNTILMDSHWNPNVIAHEVMHLYGLADLYGTNTGPGYLSMMATSDETLLTYEKWILGWLPDANVRCLSNVSDNSILKVTFDNLKENELLVLQSSDKFMYFLETSNALGIRHLSFYSLQIEVRPPFIFYPDFKFANSGGGLPLRDQQVIGSQLVGPKFTVLISDQDSNSLYLNIVPTALKDSTEFKSLVGKSEENKLQRILETQQKRTSDSPPSPELGANPKQEAAVGSKAGNSSANKPATQKKVTIICLKGKEVKKVTAVNPKCPVGYKKR